MEEHSIPFDSLKGVVDLPEWKLNHAVTQVGRGHNADWSNKGWTLTEKEEKAKVITRGGQESVQTIPSHDVLSLFHSGVLTLSEDPHKQDAIDNFLKENGLTREMLKPRVEPDSASASSY